MKNIKKISHYIGIAFIVLCGVLALAGYAMGQSYEQARIKQIGQRQQVLHETNNRYRGLIQKNSQEYELLELERKVLEVDFQ